MTKLIHKERGKRKMNAISTIYWLRAILGIISGAICAAVSRFLETKIGIQGTSIILYSITLSLLLYLLSIRLLKAKFLNKVETPSKITMTGIGIYFIAWLAFYTLFYTIILATTGTLPTTPSEPIVIVTEIILL